MISLRLVRRVASIAFMALTLHLPFSITASAEDTLSTGEDVAIAFFKTAKTNPDFTLWAKGSNDYKTAAPAFADEYLEEEKQRLLRRWNEYNPREDTLEMRLNVTIALKSEVKEDGSEEYRMHITFPATSADIMYFPYTFQQYKFAVIPQHMEKLALQSLYKPQYDLMLADFENKATGAGHLYVQLAPFKAYIDQPYSIDGLEQWGFITNVAALSLKSARTGAALWNYTAPWYLSPVKEELTDLYKDSPQ